MIDFLHGWCGTRDLPRGSLRANFAYTSTELASEEVAKRHAIGIANRRGDLLPVITGSPQQMHRTLDTQVLEVGERASAEHAVDAPRQRSLARPDCVGGLVKRETVGKVVAGPTLESLHERIGVREMIADRVNRLRRSRINDQVTRGGLRK